MTTISTRKLFVCFCMPLFFGAEMYAQQAENPGDYISSINDARREMDKRYLKYMSAAAHGAKDARVEQLRQETLASIEKSKYKISELPYYKGDNSLRQSSIDYVQLCYKVFNEDYAHIVNMEEIAEQSVDEMEAYLLMQEQTNEKLRQAGEGISKAVKDFAVKYNVRLIDAKDELDEKMEAAAKLMHYRNKVYLIFFKCNWQDGQITNAINNNNLTNIEQSRNALISYANEGLAALDTLKSFEGDASLTTACKKTLGFYKKLADEELPKVTDYFLKKENFEKIKSSFDAKTESSRTKQVVDAYNKAVKEVNNATNAYNETNNRINEQRARLIEMWNETDRNFSNTHMPYY